MCKSFCLPHERNWWEHKPKVIENKNTTILWDFDIHTDKTIQENRPGIVIKNHNDKTCFLIDMSVPSDTNVPLKIFEKLSKFKDLEIEAYTLYIYIYLYIIYTLYIHIYTLYIHIFIHYIYIYLYIHYIYVYIFNTKYIQ